MGVDGKRSLVIARDLHAVLAQVRGGSEVVVEQDNQPVAVLRAAEPPRMISDCIALAEQREPERGYAITLDPKLAETAEEVVRNRQPWNPPSWD